MTEPRKITKSKYLKIQKTRPRLLLVQNEFLVGLFWGELMFGGAYFRREFLVSKWVGIDNKNTFKHQDNSKNSLKQLTLTVHGLMYGRACYRRNIRVCDLGGLLTGGLIILI